MLIGTLEQGLVYAILALGVYITYKILDFPDLSVDGTFPLGAVITVMCITNGINPLLAMLLSICGGALAGLITGIVHVKLKVRDLLSGIITMTALWSVNLIIANNNPSITITPFKNITLFINNPIVKAIPESIFKYSKLIIILLIVVIAKLILDFYLKTKSGYLLRAVGDNSSVVTTLAKDSGSVKIVGLVISNALVALAGSIMCQQQRSYNLTMGTGAIVIGLASVIIGINIFKKASIIKSTSAVIVGSVLYQGCVAIAIKYVPVYTMKLITAVFFLIILVISERTKSSKHKAKVKTEVSAV